jgi:ribonuclease HII
MSVKTKLRRTMTAGLEYEFQALQAGNHHIFGIDEVGYGAWAGPVTAGVACLPINDSIQQALAGVRDSKAMTPRQRLSLVERIKSEAITWGIGAVEPQKIDEIGIAGAVRLAMERAVQEAIMRADITPDCLFVDGLGTAKPLYDCPHQPIKHGDALSLSIACASVLAKVWRDQYMIQLGEQMPNYGFESHKGYGTAKHMQALKIYGVSAVHRHYYKPIRAILEGN